VNEGACAYEQYCFKEGMGADVEEGKLGLIKSNGDHHQAQLAGGRERDDFLNVVLC